MGARGSERAVSMPFLSLRPVDLSFSDGFSIPAPPTGVNTPPQTPTPETRAAKSASTYGGPLSSHPVTPIDTSESYFPHHRRDSATSRLEAFPAFKHKSSSTDLHNTSSSSHYQPQHIDPAIPSPSTDMADRTPPQSHSRRQSFATRFLRFRSLSSLRSSSYNKQNDSSTSLAPSERRNGGYQNDYYCTSVAPAHSSIESRGLKRAASPASPCSTDKTVQDSMRKRSMGFLTTARRASGMWGGRSTPAFGDELEDHHDQENTAPQLPEVRGLSTSIGGEELFSNIGR